MATGNKIANVTQGYKCLVHLDRLSLTFRLWSGSTFNNIRNPDAIPQEQSFNEITIIHDTNPGLGAYYHSYQVFYKGIRVGKLHTATKLKKNEVLFDFSKEIFYAYHPRYWYDVYMSLKTNLGIIYNNIRYLEISIDTNKDLLEQFRFLYQNTISNLLRVGDRYQLRANAMVHTMANGRSFIIEGSENEIAIYNKSRHAETFILKYFENNGLTNGDVHRIEARLTWNYIRYLRNRKALDINVESLLDQGNLVSIFKISTLNKITFKDITVKTYDKNRNKNFQCISIIDNLDIEAAQIGKLNPGIQACHYKTTSVDENIMRQNYYMFLETGNKKYLRHFKLSGAVADYKKNQLINFVHRLNGKYNGNRTSVIQERMKFAECNISKNPAVKMNRLFHSMILNLKSALLNLF